MINNLPILDMTLTETAYYDRLIQALSSTRNILCEQQQHPSDCSNKLLSVALLDCLLGILDCSTSFFQSNDLNIDQWEKVLATMRQEVKSRWTMEEKLVLKQVDT
jgi:hypothetical protein